MRFLEFSNEKEVELSDSYMETSCQMKTQSSNFSIDQGQNNFNRLDSVEKSSSDFLQLPTTSTMLFERSRIMRIDCDPFKSLIKL